MITFEPLRVLPQNFSSSESLQTIKDNLANEKLAKQLNQMFQGKTCPKHPATNSIVLVNLKEELDFLRVISFCCDDFKKELDGLAEPQKNYSISHHD